MQDELTWLTDAVDREIALAGREMARLREEAADRALEADWLARCGEALREAAARAASERAAREAREAEMRLGRLQAWRSRLERLASEVRAAGGRMALGVRILEAQEEERRRLARDIHDGPAQILANVVFRLDVCQRMLTAAAGPRAGAAELTKAVEELEQLKVLVRHSLQDVRKILFDLRPLALDDLGLVPALRTYLAGFEEKTGLRCGLQVQGEERRLPQALEVGAFRLVQEALNNTYKHAHAQNATVSVEFRPGVLHVAVEDDGDGFDVERTLNGGRGDGFGLVSMHERAALLGGHVRIRSRRGEGTRVSAELPVPSVP